jgi:carbamoyl-phosphate synthase/aspartate carbamoyltransferase/dihydroorotase
MHDNPRRLFNLPLQEDTWVEVDEDASFEIRAADCRTRCGWTPFEGRRVYGRLRRVVLRGEDAFRDDRVLARAGSGMNLRAESNSPARDGFEEGPVNEAGAQ